MPRWGTLQTTSSKRNTLRVLTSAENSADAPIEQHFRDNPMHRAEDNAPYDLKALATDRADCLLRSKQEFGLPANPERAKGNTLELCWISALFRLEEEGEAVFVYFVMKSATYSDRPVDETYRVTTYASSPALAGKVLTDIREKYGPTLRARKTGPGIFLLKDNILKSGPDLIEISDEFHIAEEKIELHYGKGANKWLKKFEEALIAPGFSILHGPPGTGKTSILRHLIRKHQNAIRFYFLPVEQLSLLTSSTLLTFWELERNIFPQEAKVLVLEDAENLINEREFGDRGAVSWLLNFTDGLTTKKGQPHIVCTLNAPSSQMDAALKRPGRLRFILISAVIWTQGGQGKS